MTALESLNWRYATKQFDPTKKLSSEDWQTLEQSLVLTPSSFGLQPWKFIIVTNQDTKEALRPHSWGQSQITDSSHLVVFTSLKEVTEDNVDPWIATMAEAQGKTPQDLEGYKDVVMGFIGNMSTEECQAWTQRQAYIALGQFMLTAATMNIDTCPLEGIAPEFYDQILDLSDTPFSTCVACAVGYRSADDKYATSPKTRFTSDQVIQHIS